MCKKILFSYDIEFVKVNVYHCDFHEKSSLVNKEFYNGVIEAIAEYLFYPVEVVAPRVNLFSVDFEYDKEQLEDIGLLAGKYIAECTKEAFLKYMEESVENSNQIIHQYVTTPDLRFEKINHWCNSLRNQADKTSVNVHVCEKETQELKWVEFRYEHGIFYGRYKDCDSDKLLVSLPGYNSDWNDLSVYIDGNYDILQLSPLGYNTPYGFDEKKRVKGAWPVLYDTVSETEESVGYNQWFFEVCLAIKAIRKENQKLLFLGTSQGGGASLIMSSIFNDCTVACASEMPFLIGFSDFNYSRVRNFVANQINNPDKMIYDFYAKERLFVIDPIVHSSRIVCPTLLVSGELDSECLPKDIYKLYQTLNCKKKYIELKDQGHGYTKEFMGYAKRWISNGTIEDKET